MSNSPQSARELTPQQLSDLVMRRRRQREGGPPDGAGAGGSAASAAAAAAASGSIRRRGAGCQGQAPLSFAQLRLWLLDQLQPQNAAYNLPAAWWLHGALSPAALAGALGEIVRRHETLRTTFEQRDGDPVQVIAPPSPLQLPLIDLSPLPPPAAEREARRLAQHDATTPFDLARGPLVRAAVVRLGGELHALLFNMHHIISDGWSYGLLFGELSALYAACLAGQPPPRPAGSALRGMPQGHPGGAAAAKGGSGGLAELPIQYADFAAWQRQWLRGAVLAEQVAYWRQRLAGVPPSLDLPADRVRPPVAGHRGQQALLIIGAATTAALRELSWRERATPFMTLLSAFMVLLARWAGQEDIVVGSPAAGRQRVETESLIGFFLNTLVLRADLGGNPSFTALLAQMRDVVLDAYRYQDLPFERLLEELQVERQVNRSPLFQVLFNMITLPEIRLDLAGLRVEPFSAGEPLTKFDLTLYLEERNGAIHCDLVYNADLFDRARMAALLGELEHLLIQIAAAPETPIGALSLVPPAAAVLLPDPTRPLAAAAWPGPIHRRLTLHAARSPERLMVADGRESWSRGELETRANQLAHRLRQAGVGREDVVAIHAHRSASLVWAVLGTLKAGAAFLILDPAYPARRLAAYLDVARPAALLEVSGAAPPPPEVEEALAALGPRLRLELPPRSAAAALGLLDALPAGPPEIEVCADDLACVGFTSGTTGRPKAVLGRHGPLSQFYPWWEEHFALGENDRFAMLSALSHDPLQRDILTPVWLGASLHVPEPERLGEPGWLAGWVAREGVTVLHLTPAMLELLADDDWAAAAGDDRAAPSAGDDQAAPSAGDDQAAPSAGDDQAAPSGGALSAVPLTGALSAVPLASGDQAAPLPLVRRAFVVGDLLRRSEVARLQRMAPAMLCVNLYGSTETQRALGFAPVPRPEEAPAAAREALPLGRGIPGVELLVLNAAGILAGIGELGEVFLRSRQLARGYLADAELTARRFLANPFRPAAADPTDRLYRTGDLGRYQPDGTVDFAGRADQQVKIRGFRIEPGEIEAVLRRHPAVGECVVVARGDSEKRLIAYLAPAAGAVPAAELRQLAGARLPDYMVPAAFVWLAALPLTRTGKLDRAALPEPSPEPAAARVAPRSPVEELLAGIWQELLAPGREIGVHDNFFDLGGHSLLATRVLARLRQALGVEVPLRRLFEAPTLGGLAAAAVQAQAAGVGGTAPPPRRGPRGHGELPLSFAQRRLWVLDQLEPGSIAHILAGGLRLQGELAAGALGRAIAEIRRRPEVLRSAFPSRDGEPWQQILPAVERPLPLVDLSALPEPARATGAAALAAADALLPFAIAGGRLVRTTLLRLGGRDHVLLLALHHMVTDGWSMGIFTHELTELYRAFAAGAPSPLPELPLQYADFALWQRGWLAGEVVAKQLGYWSGELAGAPPVLELPGDRPRPALQSHRGGRRWLALDRALTERLGAACRRLDVTPFMALLAAFAALLGRYSGAEDLVVGTPIANRGHRELEELIGFFANTLALRLTVTGGRSYADLVRQVRQAALGAYAHQDLPFERLVEELRPERDLGTTPIFQVMFILQNAPAPELSLGGLTLSPVEAEEGKAPFDLTLALIQAEGELRARLEFSLDLFDAVTAERLLAHFGNLVQGAVEQPRALLAALPLLGEAERQELLLACNDTAAAFPRELTVHELCAASARRRPEAVAVACGGRRLLYRDLDERAERLAGRLVSLGVGPEVRVGICMARTPEMVVALLAVLKAGGAYVPLDPGHPGERLSWILRDAAAHVLIADRESLAVLPEHPAVVVDPADPPVGVPGTGMEATGAGATAPCRRRAGPENLAYVIYTSGSTGRPKGVEVRHRGVVNYLTAMARRPGLEERDTVLALTTLAFDIAVTELLLPLAVGARIEIVDRETAADAERLAAVIEAAGVTLMQATPATWTLLLDGGWRGRPGLRMLAGGEALPAALAERLLASGGELWNVYGPTETTVWSALHPVGGAEVAVAAGVAALGRAEEPEAGTRRAARQAERRVPIGRPLANTTVHLLDRGFELAPATVPGELCIGGEGLARGYLGRPDLTAERFIPDPFAGPGAAGSRLYRTGDLARRRGGELEFLGRIDHQVKVRGYRIELGEIEAALAGLPGIAQAAVVARERAAGERQLVAFLIAAPSPGEAPPAPRETPPAPAPPAIPATAPAASPIQVAPAIPAMPPAPPILAIPATPAASATLVIPATPAAPAIPRTPAAPAAPAASATPLITELRAALLRRLPDYMVPGIFTLLPALPLGPSGKVDRRALARLPLDAAGDAGLGRSAPVAPRTEMEALLAGIWAEVLGRAQVGVLDNFFEVGGDSILAIRVVARAHRAGIRLTPRQLFQQQTIAALAGVVEAPAAVVEAPPARATAAAGAGPRARAEALTPLDFPAADLSQEGLDALLADLAAD